MTIFLLSAGLLLNFGVLCNNKLIFLLILSSPNEDWLKEKQSLYKKNRLIDSYNYGKMVFAFMEQIAKYHNHWVQPHSFVQ